MTNPNLHQTMPERRQTILQFVLTSHDNPLEIMYRFLPEGRRVLNRIEWRGKEPRSCAVTNVTVRPRSAGSNEPYIADIEVTYRPKGCITFVGGTKYDGWTAMMLDRKKDGTLLDGRGNPLPESATAVYLTFEVYNDVDFNQIEFGDFVGEHQVGEIERLEFEAVLEDFFRGGRASLSTHSTFMSPRRFRPFVKIILSDAPSGVSAESGDRIVNVNRFTPHLTQVVVDQLMEVVSGFVEGRYSLKNVTDGERVLVELSDVLVDCTPNAEGKPSRFNCLKEFVPDNFLEDLAKRLMSTYEVHACVVEGTKSGLLLRLTRSSA
jgi:hypothetical protein